MSTRRARNEGGLRKRADGRWEGTLYAPISGPKSAVQRRYFYGRTKSEAAAKLRQAREELARVGSLSADRMSLNELLDLWLEQKSLSIRSKTVDGYAQKLSSHVRPVLGSMTVNSIGTRDIAELHRKMGQKGLSPRSCKHVHSLLRAALDHGLVFGLAASNPAALCHAPKVPNHRVGRSLSKDEYLRFLDAAADSPLEALFVLAATTGMRQGEILGLRWRDLSLEAGCLTVTSALGRDSDNRLSIERPKTRSSTRRIELAEIAIAALIRHRSEQNRARLAAGASWNDLDLVFPNRVGNPMNASNLVRREFKPLLAAAQVPEIRFHDLRHTCATVLLGEGVPVSAVSALLGHADQATTLSIYAHALPGVESLAASALNEWLAVS